MSYTIFSKSNVFPVPVAGTKTVKTFSSGLILVTQEYAVPRGQEAAYAATFAVGQPLNVESPTNEILYISTEPEWRDSGDGFTRISVSAHSKMPDQQQINQSYFLGSIDVVYTQPASVDNGFITSWQTITIPEQTLNESYVKTIVVENDTPPNLAQELQSVPDLKIYFPDGTLVENKWPQYEVIQGYYIETVYNFRNNLVGVDQTSFGKYSEMILKFQAYGHVNRTTKNGPPPT